MGIGITISDSEKTTETRLEIVNTVILPTNSYFGSHGEGVKIGIGC